jgi:hypothetical protein
MALSVPANRYFFESVTVNESISGRGQDVWYAQASVSSVHRECVGVVSDKQDALHRYHRNYAGE